MKQRKEDTCTQENRFESQYWNPEGTAVKNGSETCVIRKTEENLLYVSQTNYLRIVLGTCLTDCLPNNSFYGKFYFLDLLEMIDRYLLEKDWDW